MAALGRRGGLAAMAAGTSRDPGELQRRLGARPGYLRVALRLLADQGWVRLGEDENSGNRTVTPTPRGTQVMSAFAHAYDRSSQLLLTAERMDDILFGATAGAGAAGLAEAVGLMRAGWELGGTSSLADARAQVAAHLNGHVVTPVMAALSRRAILRPGVTEVSVPDLLIAGATPAITTAFEALEAEGWAVRDGDTIRLTPAGSAAAACAPQYWHPMCYVPLFRRVPGLLFGELLTAAEQEPAPAAGEEHPDRELDIMFSGEVFARTCREPFLEIVLPLFNEPPARQPSAVVDVGCGDGTLLATLYEAIRTRTERGSRLGPCPLRMVGVEPSPVARRVAAQRLDRSGVPAAVIEGDITDPDDLGKRLTGLGIDAGDALYVCKSVIHDRSYAAVSADPGTGTRRGQPPALYGAFAAPSGESISGKEILSSLAALFRSWLGLAGRHGFVVVEAHAVDPVVAAAMIGRTMATSLDATHGYSHQYPVTPEAFSWAARAGGFASRAHRAPGSSLIGYTALTIDHFVPAMEG